MVSAKLNVVILPAVAGTVTDFCAIWIRFFGNLKQPKSLQTEEATEILNTVSDKRGHANPNSGNLIRLLLGEMRVMRPFTAWGTATTVTALRDQRDMNQSKMATSLNCHPVQRIVGTSATYLIVLLNCSHT
jgi:hypothetical protein